MSFKVVLLERVERQVESTYAWLAERSVGGANRWLNQFTLALSRLESDPTSYPLAPEADDLGREIRELHFKTRRGGTYRAVFQVVNDTVLVLQVRAPGQPLIGPEDV